MIGYVLPIGSPDSSVLGGIYDCATGSKAADISYTFRWHADTVDSLFKCYLGHSSTSMATVQLMHLPRVDVVDGTEPSIEQLIGIVKAKDVQFEDAVTLDYKKGNWDSKIDNVGMTAEGLLSVNGNAIPNAKLTDTQRTDTEIQSLADDRAIAQITNKIGNDQIISNLKLGRDINGAPLLSKGDIGLGNVEDKSVAEIQDEIVQATRTQMVDTNWELGSGATPRYTLKGNPSENYRVMGLNHKNEKVILWECRPDSTSGSDGGFNTHSFPIDKNKTYRFSIFVKTSSTSGMTYLGCGNKICTLNSATLLTSSYFWNGDLPENNKWYLIVGYVFPAFNADDDLLSVQGGIYDCTTGAKAAMVTKSFNWDAEATIGYLSCYHMYDTNTATRQWMYHPRVDLVDGNEPSILSLIGVLKAEGVSARPSNWMPSASDVGAITDAQAQSKIDSRLSAAEKTNLVSNKTLDGQKQLYHTGNKPTAADVGAREDRWLPTPVEIGAETPEGAQNKVDAVAAEVTTLTTRVTTLETDVQELQVPNNG